MQAALELSVTSGDTIVQRRVTPFKSHQKCSTIADIRRPREHRIRTKSCNKLAAGFQGGAGSSVMLQLLEPTPISNGSGVIRVSGGTFCHVLCCLQLVLHHLGWPGLASI